MGRRKLTSLSHLGLHFQLLECTPPPRSSHLLPSPTNGQLWNIKDWAYCANTHIQYFISNPTDTFLNSEEWQTFAIHRPVVSGYK